MPPTLAVDAVVAIDFGTSSTGYAWANAGQPSAVTCKAPGLNAADAKRGKALTNLLLADDGSFRGFGKDARDEYFMELADAADSRLLFFQGYKMQLDGLAELAGTGPLIVAHSGSGGQPLLRIVSVTLKHVADEATIAAGVQAKKVLWVLTVPAIWTEAAKQLMREAAVVAGLVENASSSLLLLVSEPEAACASAVADAPGSLSVGERVVVVDCGGGTVDITTHKLESTRPPRLLLQAEPSGGAWGSTRVDEALAALLSTLFGSDNMDRLRATVAFLEVMDEWQDKKALVGLADSGLASLRRLGLAPLLEQLRCWYVEAPPLSELVDAFCAGRLVPGPAIRCVGVSSIELSHQLLIELFDTVLEHTLQHLQLHVLAPVPPESLILVGGFSRSPVLQDRVKQLVARQVPACRVLVGARPEEAVVRGAVLLGFVAAAQQAAPPKGVLPTVSSQAARSQPPVQQPPPAMFASAAPAMSAHAQAAPQMQPRMQMEDEKMNDEVEDTQQGASAPSFKGRAELRPPVPRPLAAHPGAPQASRPLAAAVSRSPMRSRLVRLGFAGASPEVNVLVIGRTGAGKSTFLNYLANLFHANFELDASAAEPFQLVIPVPPLYPDANVAGYAQSERGELGGSSTDKCSKYAFRCGSRTFTFVDTPGLSDTRGPAQDEINLQRIIEVAEEVDSLAALVLVVDGNAARDTLDEMNTLVRLRGFIPDVLFENIIIVFTKSSRRESPWMLRLSALPSSVQQNANSRMFFMQNGAFVSDPRGWSDADAADAQRQWEASLTTALEVLESMDAMATKVRTGSVFKELRTKRDAVQVRMAALLKDFHSMQRFQDALETHEQQAKAGATSQQQYADFKKKSLVTTYEFQDVSHYNTLCTACSTTKGIVCHEGCGLEYTTQVGHQIFQGCACMNGSTCGPCSAAGSSCGHASHYHDRKTVKQSTQTVETELADIKAKFEAAVNSQVVAQQGMTQAQQDLAMIKHLQAQGIEDIKKLCLEVKTICSGFNFAAELKAVVHSVRMGQQQLTSLKAQADADAQIKVLETFIDGLGAKERGRAAAEKPSLFGWLFGRK